MTFCGFAVAACGRANAKTVFCTQLSIQFSGSVGLKAGASEREVAARRSTSGLPLTLDSNSFKT